jgi:iron-sulfur cluster repair protein YtfE (RIC family)
MDLWQAITDDHRKVEEISEKLDEDSGDREELIEQLRRELEAHTQGEEKAVYPELGKIGELKDLVDHSIEEHDEVRQLLQRLEAAKDDEELSDILDELQSAVQDHVEEEEEQIIPVAQKEIASDKAETMLRDFQSAKKAALAE